MIAAELGVIVQRQRAKQHIGRVTEGRKSLEKALQSGVEFPGVEDAKQALMLGKL